MVLLAQAFACAYFDRWLKPTAMKRVSTFNKEQSPTRTLLKPKT